MNARKQYKNVVKGIATFFIVDLFIMIISILYVAFTFSPMMESAADYLREGRFTLFAVGVTVGMFVSSLLILYYVSVRNMREEGLSRFEAGESSRSTHSEWNPSSLPIGPTRHPLPPGRYPPPQ